MGLQDLQRLSVGSDTQEISRHSGGVCDFVVAFGEKFLLRKTLGKMKHFLMALLQEGFGFLQRGVLMLLYQYLVHLMVAFAVFVGKIVLWVPLADVLYEGAH